MNNKIFEISQNFDNSTFDEFNLENPIILNQNNYFSKLTHSDNRKTIYLQLPKCLTKNGIVKSNTKSYVELIFNSSEKNIIEFFENLENFLINKIYDNKDLWFYESNNMSLEDIQDLLTPIMRSYKSGKNFLVKANIKSGKINIYDENEEKINLDDYNKEFDIIPVISINGVKLSSKNFLIDINLVQFMIIYPEDTFENNFLINFNKNTKLQEKQINEVKEKVLIKDNNYKYEELIKENQDNLKIVETEFEKKSETLEIEKNEQDIEKNETLEIEKNEQDIEKNETLEIEKKAPLEIEKYEQDYKKNTISEDKRLYEKPNYKNILNLENCNEVNIDINEDNDTIELINHETIYLEIYKKAKKKAKEIKKNAVEAFIEAKNIKAKYNLNNIEDSSDEENEEIIFN